MNHKDSKFDIKKILDKNSISIGNIHSINWKHVTIVVFILLIFGSAAFYVGHKFPVLINYQESSNTSIAYSHSSTTPTVTPTSQNSQITSSSNFGWNTYTDKTNGFSFQYPKDWLPTKNISHTLLYAFTNPDNTIILSFEKTKYSNLADFQKFLNQKTATAYSEDPIANGTDIKTVTFGSNQYLYAMHPNTSISLMYAFVKNNSVFLVHFNSVGDNNTLQTAINGIMPTLNY